MSYYFLYKAQLEAVNTYIQEMLYKHLCELDGDGEAERVFHESPCCTTRNVQQREELAHVRANLKFSGQKQWQL